MVGPVAESSELMLLSSAGNALAPLLLPAFQNEIAFGNANTAHKTVAVERGSFTRLLSIGVCTAYF
jgi:hypothetical protein